jgi:imidazolonepropionase-like amidohydrolase
MPNEWKPWIPPEQDSLVFRNAKVVDTLNAKTDNVKEVFVSKGKFVSAQDVKEHWNFQEVNLENEYFLCPGLIDCHVHLTANAGQESMRELFQASSNAIAYRTTWNAKQMLRRGFTTVRDTGGADYALRQAIEEGVIQGPRVFIAGKALSQTGGHGDLRQAHQGDAFRCCDSTIPGFARVCDGVPACLEAARDELRQGAHFLKIMVGGGVSSPADPLDMLQFTAEEIQAITTTARQMRKIVTAHAYTVDAIRHAIDNGCMGIEHGNMIDNDTAKLCKEKGITVTPTLVTYKAMSEPPYEEFLPPDGRIKNKRVLASGVEALRTLSKAGVAMCFGTDLLAGMHERQNEEFSIRKAALSNAEILQSATVNGAKYLGVEDTIGQIKEGYVADLLILKSNPLEDVTILARPVDSIVGIIKDGRVVLSKLPELEVASTYR